MTFPRMKGLRPYVAGACVVLTLAVGNGWAGDNDADLRSLLDQQSKQIAEQQKQLEELRHRLDATEATKLEARTTSHEPALNDGSVQKIVADYLDEKDNTEKDEAKAQLQKADDEGYKVGTILGISGKFDQNCYPWVYTPNKDFTMH